MKPLSVLGLALPFLSACTTPKEAETDPRLRKLETGPEVHGELGAVYSQSSGHR